MNRNFRNLTQRIRPNEADSTPMIAATEPNEQMMPWKEQGVQETTSDLGDDESTT